MAVLPTNIVNGQAGHAALHNDTNTQVNTNTTDLAALTTTVGGKQASDADLTAIAALTPSNDDILQRKAGAWTNRTIAQLKTDLALAIADTSGLQAALDAKGAITETVNVIAATGSTETVPDVTTATMNRFTLDANCTFTMPTAVAGKSISAEIRQSTGSHTATFTGVKWAGGVAPTFSTGAGDIDVVSFICFDATEGWLGFVAGKDLS